MSATITAELIKELRDRTGVGIGKCKEALSDNNGDIEEAIAALRKAGIAGAVKKEGRATNEGMIGFAETADCVSVVEVNAETDFVVRNERFQAFLTDMATEIANTKPESLEAFLGQNYSKDSSLTVDQYRSSVIQAIGENIQIKRFKIMDKTSDLSIGVYSHLGGKMLTAVEISGSHDQVALAKDIAMHVAAAAPEYLTSEDVPVSVIEHEKEIARSQMQGKPENVIEKILDGKISKYFDENCLTRQLFIKNDSLKIADLVEQKSKESGKTLQITNFLRWSVGQ